MVPDNNQLYQALFEDAPDGMGVLDNSGDILLLNRKALEITGYPDVAELQGKNIVHILDEADQNMFQESFSQVRSSGAGIVQKSGIRRKDGSLTRCEFQFSRVPGAANSPGIVIVSFRDVSERARSEEALISAVRMLNRFNSITRHDIMNQLTILLGYLELSHDMVTDNTLKEFISREEGAAETIRKQVAFTKEYQDVGVNAPTWIDLFAVVRETASVVDHPGMKVEVRIDPGLKVFADPLIRKIISNFIENTVLHGKTATEITITSSEQPGGLVIAFSDNGAGVPAEDKERIFTRGFGSKRGYGLYLAREILALNGLTIAETGEAGKGARFEITVPKGGYRV
ncbi:MAG: PAS domain-containing sensor histidine kinase [Methanoregulaceae archaeon]|nr:PAS domain-containing sensor histidine kinase [Methanoregulaceae archaeon]